MPDDAPSLDTLRARIRAMERLKPPPAECVGIHPQVDPFLPGGGLALACLHQVMGETGPVTAFAATIAGRLAERRQRPVLWALATDDLHAAGLDRCGLCPDEMIVAVGRTDTDILWTMEEGLRSNSVACVVAEIASLDTTAGRRLQLAAETGGTTGLLLHPPGGRAANAGTTRWRVAAAPGNRTRMVLERARNGRPGEWVVAP